MFSNVLMYASNSSKILTCCFLHNWNFFLKPIRTLLYSHGTVSLLLSSMSSDLVAYVLENWPIVLILPAWFPEKILKMSWEVLKMSLNVLKCPKMSWEVLKMSMNVLKCPEKSWKCPWTSLILILINPCFSHLEVRWIWSWTEQRRCSKDHWSDDRVGKYLNCSHCYHYHIWN